MAEGSRTQLQCGIGNCLNHAPGNIKNSKAREVCRNGTVIKNGKVGVQEWDSYQERQGRGGVQEWDS